MPSTNGAPFIPHSKRVKMLMICMKEALMQEPYEIFTPAEGVRVVACRTERFKTGQLSVQLVLPLVGDVSAFSLLPYLLSRA